MSQRTAKVESLVRQTVARMLVELRPEASAKATVTSVEAARDLKLAVVWISVLEFDQGKRQQTFAEVEELRDRIQSELASIMTSKFTPRLSFKLDNSSQHADTIERLIKKLD